MAMAKTQNKSNSNKKKRWRMVLVGFVFVFLFFRSAPSLLAVRSRTVLPENILVEDKIQAKAIIIKKEYLYKAYGEGKVEILSEEGEKVGAGTELARLILLKDNSTLNQDLKEIDNKIDTLVSMGKDDSISKNDSDKIEENIDDLVDNIQQSISQGDYENVIFLKDKLSIYEGKQKNISGEGRLINQSLESLENKREEIINQISSNSKDYFSQEPGVFSLKIDGYEEIYSFNHKDEYSLSDFEKIDKEEKKVVDNDDVDTGDSIFKIIDNFEWYMVIKIENMDDVDFYEEGDNISVTEYETKGDVDGRIEKINKEKGKALILCKFNTDFEQYYDKRYIEIDIVRSSQEGYKIPTRSIVKKDNIKGVYVKDISGIIKFKPVKIIIEEDKTTYVECGDENNNIQIEGYEETFKTITAFDEIFSNTMNIKEGMVIN